jgi:cell division protein FtsI (penicillin-binding protein 3)
VKPTATRAHRSAPGARAHAAATAAAPMAPTPRTPRTPRPTRATPTPPSKRAATPSARRAAHDAPSGRSRRNGHDAKLERFTATPTARGRTGPASKAPRKSETSKAATSKRVRATPPREKSARFRAGSPRRRLIAALALIAVVMGAIVVRVAFLQTTEAESLRSAAADQWTRTVTLPGLRGALFDRHGAELSMSVPAATISINPKLIDNGPATLQLLDDMLDLSDEKVAELAAEIESKERGFVFVARQADAGIGDQIAELRLAGVNVDRESRREMPGGDTGRSVVGRTNIDGVGISGLELQYEDLLAGTDGRMRREVAPAGRSIPGSETITEAPVAGNDLVLTLDRSVQFSTEQVLLEKVSEIGARGATAIAMDTDTGEIYSMASVRRDDETGEYAVTSGNYAAVDAYEPGSVAKVITIASALSEGLVAPESTYVVPWSKEYYDVVLTDSHQHPDEVMSVAKILATSSNIGTIFVQEELGYERHRDYMADFGLGSRSALDFPGESPGILKEADELQGSERVTVSYGQGVSSTSVQLVAAVNAIANGGVYVAPKLVQSIVGADGEITDTDPSVSRRVITEEAAAQTTEMLRTAVCLGTAKRAQVEGLPIAGKTGTAFKAADNGTYFDENGNRVYYASFVGFFPADDPQVTVLVSVDEPPAGSGDRFGGTASAPVFAELAPTLIHELGIRPTPGEPACPEAG